jgi:hypothetical protein
VPGVPNNEAPGVEWAVVRGETLDGVYGYVYSVLNGKRRGTATTAHGRVMHGVRASANGRKSLRFLSSKNEEAIRETAGQAKDWRLMCGLWACE